MLYHFLRSSYNGFRYLTIDIRANSIVITMMQTRPDPQACTFYQVGVLETWLKNEPLPTLPPHGQTL